MARYIDAEKIRITAQTETENGEVLVSLADVRRAIEQTPTADVVEVRHGEWIKDEKSKFEHRYYCSACNFYLFGAPTKYCEECGAKMDGERSVQDD